MNDQIVYQAPCGCRQHASGQTDPCWEHLYGPDTDDDWRDR